MSDSRIGNYEHIYQVQTFMNKVINDLLYRQLNHDRSKLISPEVEIYDKNVDKLAASTFGSEEYNSTLKEMKVALDHHYANNSHHPEFHQGIANMSLVDLLEMLCDWKAASLRHANGDINRSIEYSQLRYGYSDELKNILINTLRIID